MKKNRRNVPPLRRIELDYSEKWGKDVEEAVRLALIDLKLNRDEVVVTVIEEPVRGFLGIGAKLAKVRVEKKEDEDIPVKLKEAADEGDAKPISPPKNEGKTEDAEKPAMVLNAGDEGEESPAKHKVRDLRKKKTNSDDSAAEKRSDDRKQDSSRSDRQRPAKRESRRGEKRESGRRDDRRGSDKPRSDAADTQKKSESADFEGIDYSEKLLVSDRPEGLVPAAEGNEAESFFKELVLKMGLDINVRALENGECVYIEVDGKDSRTVIGKRGQTLDAIQYLTNLVMNKNQDKYIRVIVDVEGYRSRREKTLELLAAKLAKKVEKTGRNVRLEPMNPYERKVIHATLQANPQVTTRSEGEEPYRRVVIEKK
jgi:spoIIIJ-associated protein